MKIGIYKPYKKVCFNDDDEKMLISYEVVNLMKIFAKHKVHTYLLSEADCTTVNNKYIHIDNTPQHFDRILMFCGKMTDVNIEQKLKQQCDVLDFVMTDYLLQPNTTQYFNNIYLQTKRKVFENAKHVNLEYLKCYEHIPQQMTIDTLQNKTIKTLFGGNERQRLNYIEKYVKHFDVLLGKIPSLNIDNRVSNVEYKKLLNNTKYSIVFSDDIYNDIGFISHRLIENAMHNIYSFVDEKYDLDEQHILLNDFCRVSSEKELFDKIQYLENNPEEHLSLLKKQLSTLLTKDALSGKTIYKQITQE